MCLLDRWKDSTDLPLETDWDGALVGYLGSLARHRCMLKSICFQAFLGAI